MTTSLELGCDCLGEIRYLDAVLHDTRGEPYAIPNAICIHEEDDARPVEARRRRRPAPRSAARAGSWSPFHVTVANYEYLVYWRFYQDGNIECEVRATGIMVTTHFAEGEQPPYGTLVDERTYAPFHQHFLVARLDLDVDGEANTVHASESEALPVGPDNPHGLALVQRNTPLRTEQEGKQDYDWETQRAWKVVNDERDQRARHAGRLQARARRRVPADARPGLPGAAPRPGDRATRSGSRPYDAGRALAVRRVRRPERAATAGCRRGPRQDRSIEDTDVVLWYVFGIHHITRPEDWPIMPVDTVSFWLKPFGFFDRNPALDVAPTPAPLPVQQEDR